MAHTQAPWGFDTDEHCDVDECYAIINDKDELVMEYAGCGSHMLSIPNSEDALLIAAAPELLEALVALVNNAPSCSGDYAKMLHNASDVITKATGRSN